MKFHLEVLKFKENIALYFQNSLIDEKLVE